MAGIRHKKGFTLIEVILSIAILSIIIGPILSLTLSTVKINKQSDDKLKAISLAQKHLEEIKSSEYTLPANLSLQINDNKSESGFDIERTITPIETYKVDDSTITSITYDAEVNDDIPSNSIIPGDLLINYVDSNNLKIELKDSTTRGVNVKIKLTGNTSVSVDLNNDSSEVLNIYFTKDSKDYSISRCTGRVKTFTNIPDEVQANDNKYRLYKIVVEVKKNGKSLQKIEGYKTCLK